MVTPTTSLFNSLIWPVQKTDGSWRMTASYCKLNQVVTPVVAAVLDVASLLHQINISPGTWYAAIDLGNTFSSSLSTAPIRSSFFSSWQSQQYTFIVLPQECINSLAPCHSLIHRDLDHLSLSQDLMLVYYSNDTLLIGPRVWEEQLL